MERSSVRLSVYVCPVDRQQQQCAAGLLQSALWAGDIDRQLRARCGRRAAANEGSVTFATGGRRRLHTDLL